MHPCHQSAHGVGAGGLGVMHQARFGACRTGVVVANIAPVSAAIMPVFVLLEWGQWAEGSSHAIRLLLLLLVAVAAPAVAL